VEDLSAVLEGRLLLPGDPEAAALASPFNLAVPVTPLAVVAAASAADVVAAVRFAARHGVEVAVQATGHGAVPVDSSTLLVHTGRLDECTVHPEGWARVGAGVRWQQVLDAAAQHGLAPLAGSSPGVGVVGYTTGGGTGPVARTYGLASDRVRAFEVVTGDGVLRRVTPTEHPDLFWGLRGGKGALGIVTAVEFDLLAVDTLYAGALYFDGADAATVLTTWQRWTATLPRQATTSIALLQLPPLPGVPEPLAGRATLAVRFAWTGDPADGEAVLAPVRECATPLVDGVGVLPYAALGAVHADPVDPMPVSESQVLLDELPEEAVTTLLEAAGPGSGSPQLVVEVRQLGGAVARTPEVPSAVCHRTAAFSLLSVGVAAPPVVEAVRAHAARLQEAMAPWTSGGALVNFTGTAERAAIERAYDAETLQRLTALAEHFDPHRVLACARALRTPHAV
jgi:FAD/FMN-containing dehydrogenase